MISSLRGRLIAGLLVLTAVGLGVLAAATYLSQRAFVFDQIDKTARDAIPAIDRATSEAGAVAAGAPFNNSFRDRESVGRRGRPIRLPPGAIGERHNASGRVIARIAPAVPDLPTPLPQPTSRDTAVLDGFRVVAGPSRFGPDIIVVAVPTNEARSVLSTLLLVELLVIGAVLLLLGLGANAFVRLGLRPLERIEGVAAAIAAGDLTRRVEPANDRTEIGRLGLALNRMLTRLEQAFAARHDSEQRLRQFLSDASHELRTPLSSIRGYAELHRMGALSSPDQAARAWERVENETKRMGTLVDGLLTLARHDRKPTLERSLVDLCDLTRDAVEDARASAPDRRIEVSADERAFVVGDPNLLRQVLANLLHNAVVHTDDGTPIEVLVGHSDGQVELTVRDHGTGVPADKLEKIFERFWRAEGGRARGRAGSGLGLAIAASIAQEHGGTIRASNADDGGARFTMSLPEASPETPG